MPSCPPPERWIARAQAWLGTLVEVVLPASDADEFRFAAAFAAIARVHRLMSAHDPRSDLARIGRDAHRRKVVVDAETYAVLEIAQALFRESGGAFDVTIAPALVRDGMLPSHASGRRAQCGRMDALRLVGGSGVRADVPLALDLGGIAKGFAVDRAVAALQESGATSGIVNAGGDLRVFGDEHWMPIRVRHPEAAAKTRRLFEIRTAAAATSANYFREGRRGLVDPRARTRRFAAQSFPGSITVAAPTCVLADALTKIVALRPAMSAAILSRHHAHAFVIASDGRQMATTCGASTPNLRLRLAAVA